MPVVPRLKSIQGQSKSIKGQRINVKAQSSAGLIQAQSSAVSSIAKTGIDLHTKYEDKKVDQYTSEMEQDYTPWLDQELVNLKTQKGDPTQGYINLEKAEQERIKSYSEKHKNLSQDVQDRLSANASSISSKHRLAILKQRGAQQETYGSNLYESNLTLKRTGLPATAGYIRKDEPSTFLPFDMDVADIKTTISKRGLEQGTVERLPDDAKSWNHMYRNDDGTMVKVKMSPMAQARAAKELNEGIYNSVKVLSDSGYSAEAQQLAERYKGSIDPLNAAKLAKMFNTADKKNDANVFRTEIQDLTPAQQDVKIEEIRDPALKSEVEALNEADAKRRDAKQTRKHKKNYESLATHVMERMGSNNPYYNMSDLEKDPLYKETWQHLDSKGREAITEMVKAVKSTNYSSEARVQSLLFGEVEGVDIAVMTPTEFQHEMRGMNEKDRRRYTGLFNSLRIESASEKRATYTSANRLLMDEMFANELIVKNDFGKYDEDEQLIINKAKSELMSKLNAHGTNLDPKQIRDFVEGYTQSLVKEETFNPAPRREVKRKATEDIDLTARQRVTFKTDFKSKFGYRPRNNDEKYKSFVREEMKK